MTVSKYYCIIQEMYTDCRTFKVKNEIVYVYVTAPVQARPDVAEGQQGRNKYFSLIMDKGGEFIKAAKYSSSKTRWSQDPGERRGGESGERETV